MCFISSAQLHLAYGNAQQARTLLHAFRHIKLKEHLSQDRFSSFSFHLDNPVKISRTGNWLATTNSTSVALYDLAARKELWSCPLILRAGHQIDQLKVSLQGRVIVITSAL